MLNSSSPSPQNPLEQLRNKIESNENFSFVKLGDGEMICMQPGAKGANCDGQEYSWELGKYLRDAYSFFGTIPEVQLTTWDGWHKEREKLKAELNFTCTLDHVLLLNKIGKLSVFHYNFWKTIKNSKRKKVFIGPKKLTGVLKFLNVDEFYEVPEKNAWSMGKSLAIEPTDNSIYLFSAGLASKVWIASLLKKNRNITCIDCGSAFDPIFVGQTRDLQVPGEELKVFYKDLL